MESKFSLPEKDDIETILGQIMEVSGQDHIKDLLSAMSVVVLVLNDKQQVVFANDALLEKYNIVDRDDIIGSRFGEIISCIHSNESSEGCGTSESCRYCGVVKAFLESKKENKKVTREASVVLNKGNETTQIDLLVTAKPFTYKERIYTIYSAEDVTATKQKDLMERIFFHDIINIAGSLDNIMVLLDEMEQSERERFLLTAKKLSHQLMDEITGYQSLILAEKGDLKISSDLVVVSETLADLKETMEANKVSKDRFIEINQAGNLETFNTDKALLYRILINMLKNALEATPVGGKVVIRARSIGNNVRFSVHNSSFMPKDIQSQIFKRSFSTKGSNRGIGTYSMKLLGERYLKGKITHSTSEEGGTTFTFDLPLIAK